MPMTDWIHHYPQVEALLQHDADVLDYVPDMGNQYDAVCSEPGQYRLPDGTIYGLDYNMLMDTIQLYVRQNGYMSFQNLATRPTEALDSQEFYTRYLAPALGAIAARIESLAQQSLPCAGSRRLMR